jgi:PH-interacting protein
MAATGVLVASLRGHENDITDLAVSMDNTCLASASNDFTVRVWNLADYSTQAVLMGHTESVTSVNFAPPDPHAPERLTVITTSLDGTVKIWNVPRYGLSTGRVQAGPPATSLVLSDAERRDPTGRVTHKTLTFIPGPARSHSSQANEDGPLLSLSPPPFSPHVLPPLRDADGA